MENKIKLAPEIIEPKEKRVAEEEDYIKSTKYSNSLIKFMAAHTDGVENDFIARVLTLSEEEVEKIHQESIEMLKKEME